MDDRRKMKSERLVGQIVIMTHMTMKSRGISNSISPALFSLPLGIITKSSHLLFFILGLYLALALHRALTKFDNMRAGIGFKIVRNLDHIPLDEDPLA